MPAGSRKRTRKWWWRAGRRTGHSPALGAGAGRVQVPPLPGVPKGRHESEAPPGGREAPQEQERGWPACSSAENTCTLIS